MTLERLPLSDRRRAHNVVHQPDGLRARFGREADGELEPNLRLEGEQRATLFDIVVPGDSGTVKRVARSLHARLRLADLKLSELLLPEWHGVVGRCFGLAEQDGFV